jgi:hypothetical protein
MSRLPLDIREGQRELAYIEFEEATGYYYLNNPVNNDRTRICGAILNNNTRCKEPFGTCEHPTDVSKALSNIQNENILEVLEILARDSNSTDGKILSECISLAKNISQEDLSSLDVDIQLAYSILYRYTSKLGQNPTQKDVAYIMNILRDIVKAKEIKSRIEKVNKMDDDSALEFVTEVFLVLKTELPNEVYVKVVQAIYDRIITPRQTVKILGTKINQPLETIVVDVTE